VAVAAALGSALVAPAALGAQLDLAPGERVSLALEGRTLAVARAAPVRLPTFTYHRTELLTQRLRADRLAPVGRPAQRAIIRTSAGPMTTALLDLDGDGTVLAAPRGPGFTSPVVWCCTGEGLERVLFSESRPDALRPAALTLGSPLPRILFRGPSGWVLAETDPALDDPTRPRTERALEPDLLPAGPAALDGRWVAAAGGGVGSPIRYLALAVDGPAAPTAAHRFAHPGRVQRLWLDGGVVAHLVVAGRHRLVRYRPGGAPRMLFNARARPRAVAVGGGTVAVAIPGAVLAGRGGRVRPVAVTRGAVTAVAADGARVAWTERTSTPAGPVLRVRFARVR
jgi:hypothetical protein